MEESVNTFDESRRYTRRYAKTFYFASHILPREKRLAAYAVYSFCRYVDNVTDAAAGHADATVLAGRLNALRSELGEIYGSHGNRAAWSAFRETVLRYGIPREYFLTLIRGVEMDLVKTRYATYAELQEYCYCVASVVGLIMTRIFGASSEQALAPAADLGTAMQLTNILRDIGEDLRMGRMYIPQEEIARFGVTREDLASGRVTEPFRDLMRFQIERARGLYLRAGLGIPYLMNDGSRFCVQLMGTTYAGILDAIEKNGYDVFSRRAAVPFLRKIAIAVRQLVQVYTVSPPSSTSGESRSQDLPESDKHPHLVGG
jgi:phytoene synthase